MCNTSPEKCVSTFSSPCHQCKPPSFFCLKDARPPSIPEIQPCPPLLTCRTRPRTPSPEPTICIAGPCPKPTGAEPHSCSTCPKIKLIKPPPSCVQFCIQYTSQGTTYYPYYTSGLPTCDQQ